MWDIFGKCSSCVSSANPTAALELLGRDGVDIGESLTFRGGTAGENYLRQLTGGTKVRFNDVDIAIGEYRGKTAMREIDALAESIAHEGKVGFVGYSKDVQWQILKDAALIREGRIDGAQWHFFRSEVTGEIGADPRILRLLDRKGIPYTFH